MSREVATLAAGVIAAHVVEHEVEEIALVFHGGEPLLAGPERLNEYCQIVRSTIPAKVEFGLQTNATLLNEQLLDVLANNHVSIGISLDGGAPENDLNRRTFDGSGSYDLVVKALALLRSRPEWSRLFGGFLAVVDLQNDPHSVYDSLVSLGIRSLDLLLPDSHHDAPPVRPLGDQGLTAYGQWLSRFFDCWVDGGNEIEVRYFEEIMALLLGGSSSLEAIGAKSVDIIVIETDGDIEAVDTLKMVGRHVTNLGLNVAKNSIDDALEHPAVYSRMLGYAALCDTCQNCPDLDYCGGGYVPHRYGHGNGFLNPSVYCADLRYLISHIRTRLQPYLTAARTSLPRPS